MKTFKVEGWHGTYTVHEDQLGKGGVGSIHRTTDPDWVYKRYFEPAKAPATGQLRQLTDIGREVLIGGGLKPGDTPESSVNWPVDACVDGRGQVQGVLLPIIPQTLFNEYGDVRALEFLILARTNPPLAKGRIALLLRMAEIMDFVNARGLVHGDINNKNLAWSLTPAPVMYLIDCDGMLPQQPPPRAGVAAAGWKDPRLLDGLIPAHDKYSDWYALALAMYRGLLLTPGNLQAKQPDGSWVEPKGIPDDFAPALADLLRRGLADPLKPETRPQPREWKDALIRTFIKNGAFDEDAVRRLDAQSTKTAAPKPGFTQMPQTDWSSVFGGTGQAGTGQAGPGSAAGPGRQQGTGASGTPGTPYASGAPYTAPQQGNYPGYRVPGTFPTPQPVPVRRRIGRLAERALDRGFWWHVRGLLTSVVFAPVAVIYIAIALFQLRGLSGFMSGAAKARGFLFFYGFLAIAWMAFNLIYAAVAHQ